LGQFIALVLVVGSYYGASMLHKSAERDAILPEALETEGVKGVERL
jgi:hypothetical protein